MSLSFSSGLAWVLGAFFPLVETWRRWDQWGQLRNWPFILDDYLMGGFLLTGAVMTHRASSKARLVLAAAWGCASGAMYGSFFGQLVELGEADPSGVSSGWVVGFKGGLFFLCIAGLVATLWSKPTAQRRDSDRDVSGP
jgi:hypothetical protein